LVPTPAWPDVIEKGCVVWAGTSKTLTADPTVREGFLQT
jgi:hypothetical protein